ncbi:MAG: PAS domain S-box protein, partial [Bradymonadaceae bacterium]
MSSEEHESAMERGRPTGVVMDYLEDVPWETTSLGPFQTWPTPLKTAWEVIMGLSLPVTIFWGEELYALYNDAFFAVLEELHLHQGLGERAAQCWPELWQRLGAIVEPSLRSARPIWHDHFLIGGQHNGNKKEAFFFVNCTPLPGHDPEGVVVLWRPQTQRDMQRSLLEVAEFIEGISDGFIATDVSGLVVHINHRAAGMLGVRRDEVTGEPLAALRSHLENDFLLENIEAVRQRGKGQEEHHWQNSRKESFGVRIMPRFPDGVAIYLSPDVGSGTGRFGAGLLSDEQLRDVIFNITDFAVMMLDRNGRITTMNLGAQELFGYEFEEFIGEPNEIIFTEHDRALGRAQSEMQRALLLGRSINERWHLRKDGEPFWASGLTMPLHDSDGHHVGYVKVLHDSTEQKRAQEALRASEENFRAFAESSLDVLATLSEDGHIQYVSSASSQVFGRHPRALLGKHFIDLVHPDDVERVQRDLESLHGPKAATLSTTFRINHPAGSEHHVSMRARNLMARPEVEGIFCNIRDVTLEWRRVRQLERALDEVNETTRLKSALLANLNHEVRTPLTAIIGLANVLSAEHGEEQIVELAHIERNAQRLANTLNDMLDLARMEKGQLPAAGDEFDVVEDIRATLMDFEDAIQARGLSLRLDTPSEPVTAILDQTFFNRVIKNVIGNAVKFTENGEVHIKLVLEDDHFHLDVADTGIGIDEEFLPFVFDAFRQESEGFDRAFQGMGIGLSVARELSEVMGGEIDLKSSKGEGTCVRVTFPRHPWEGDSSIREPIDFPETPAEPVIEQSA